MLLQNNGEQQAESAHVRGDWRTLFLGNEGLGQIHRETRYPNTPLAILWLQDYLLVGLMSNPPLLKILQPKLNFVTPETKADGRFDVLPIDGQR